MIKSKYLPHQNGCNNGETHLRNKTKETPNFSNSAESRLYQTNRFCTSQPLLETQHLAQSAGTSLVSKLDDLCIETSSLSIDIVFVIRQQAIDRGDILNNGTNVFVQGSYRLEFLAKITAFEDLFALLRNGAFFCYML
jgi:hypothetical protein